MEESTIGKKVRYRDEVWEVCHIVEKSGEVVLVRIDVDVKMGAIKTYSCSMCWNEVMPEEDDNAEG